MSAAGVSDEASEGNGATFSISPRSAIDGRKLTQSLYSMAMLSSRRLLIRPLVMKLRISRLGIQALHLALSEVLAGPRGILSELSSINRFKLALCRFNGPR